MCKMHGACLSLQWLQSGSVRVLLFPLCLLFGCHPGNSIESLANELFQSNIWSFRGVYVFILLRGLWSRCREAQGKEFERLQNIHRAFALLLELGQGFAIACARTPWAQVHPGGPSPAAAHLLTRDFPLETIMLIARHYHRAFLPH